MPNADTLGSIYREAILELKEQFSERIACIENFGHENYFSAIHYSCLIIGNTSSGIIESASFGKYFVNVGSRQKGRIQSGNVVNVDFDEEQIVISTEEILLKEKFSGINIYAKQSPSDMIIDKIKRFHATI